MTTHDDHHDDTGTPIPNEPPDPAPTNGHHSRQVVDRSGETIGRRGPQHDIHAERSVAGAVLLYGQTAVDKLRAAGLEPSDVVDPTCSAVIGAAYALDDVDLAIDTITVADELAGAVDGLYTPDIDGNDQRGRRALVALSGWGCTPTAAATHASIVQRWARTRAIGYAIADAAEAHRLDDPSRLHRALEAITTTAADTLDHDTTWRPIDLEPYLDGTTTQPTPDYLHRDDGHALFYAGAVNGIHGDSGSGKGWVICRLIVENALHGRRTLLVDLEDTADSIVGRLLLLGMTADQILTWLVYIRPQEPINAAVVTAWTKLIADRNITTVVIDSLGEAFSLEGINEDKDVEVGPWLRSVARPLANTGAAVVLVDHSTKANDNPLHPSGSKRKRAAITGASYLAESIKPFVKGEGGRLRLTCAKDRHGNYRRSETVADLVMNSDTHSVGLALYAPSPINTDATVPTILAARAAVAATKKAGRAVTRDELLGLMKGAIKAGTDTKRGGIDHAVGEGALTETKGARGARIFTFDHDLQDDE